MASRRNQEPGQVPGFSFQGGLMRILAVLLFLAIPGLVLADGLKLPKCCDRLSSPSGQPWLLPSGDSEYHIGLKPVARLQENDSSQTSIGSEKTGAFWQWYFPWHYKLQDTENQIKSMRLRSNR